MRKYRDTRIVKFEQDYAPGGKTIYESGSTHAIHCETVETLKNLGVKMKVQKLDPAQIEQKRKAKV